LAIFIVSLITLVGSLIAIAFFTLAERKIIASIQRRRGPNVVGIFGMLQPIADGLKLVGKESVIPSKANKKLFIFAPLLTFAISLTNWGFMPFGSTPNVIADSNFSLFLFFATSSIGIYGIILSGWASNSRYAFLGAIRSTAQMISYEVSMGILMLPVVACTGASDIAAVAHKQSALGV
jgi:NADH-quinone oxidoreductase subunit H